MIRVYGKEGCGYCTKAINLLETKEIPFEYIKVGEDIGITEFTSLYPEIRTVPFIVRGSERIGTYTDLLKYIEESASGFVDSF